MSLPGILEQSRVVVVCGPGGIGKTTCAAAMGAAVARRSTRRVLVVTVDPARRLADALGLGDIGNDATRVKELEGRGELHVAMLDTKSSWDALIRRHAPDEETARRILSNALYQNITGRFIQSHDYIAMERLHELADTGLYDLIVVDTPPTRNALDFLDAPSRMADFFSSRLLRWLIAPVHGGVVGLAARPFSQVADRILGGPFVGDITEFFLLLNTMYDGFVERAREVEALLALPTTSFVVVSSLEAVPVDEASFFVDELKRRRLHLRGWILNKVLPGSLLDPGLDAAVSGVARDEAALAQRLGCEEVALARVRQSLVSNLARWREVARQEAEQVERLSGRGVPLFKVPTLDGEVNELTGLERLGGYLMGSPGGLESRPTPR